MTNAATTTPEKREASLKAAIGQTGARFLQMKRDSVDADARTVELAFSSETLVERIWGWEFLDHGPGACDLSILNDSAPLLLDHDFSRLVGVIENARIDSDRVGRATTRFGKSESADEAFTDVVDGIRKHVSCQYRIIDAIVDGEKDGVPIIRVTRWQPFEITLTPIPADRRVGVGRSEQTPPLAAPVAPPVSISVTRNAPMTDAAALAAEAATHEKRGLDTAMARVNEILTLGDQYAAHGGKDIAARALREGKDIRYVQDAIMGEMAKRAQASPHAPDIGMSEAETQHYSVLRALNALVASAQGERDAWKGAGLEREAHEACAKRHGAPQHGGILVPYEVQKREIQRRDMTVGTANAGGYLVGTQNDASSFIDLLRARALVAQLGATMLPNLRDNVTIPKQTAAGSAYWLSTESTAATESQMTLGQVALTPKNVAAYTELSRQLMLQSSPAADMLVMNDLAKIIALAIDLAAISGSGSSGQPTGIVNTSGVGSVSGSSLAYAGILEFQTDVAAAEALTPNCAYITTPTVASLLAQRQKFSSTDTPLWVGNVLDGNMCGFAARSTTQMAAGTALFGDFSSVVIGQWGVLELALNPYANFAAGIIGVRAFQTTDIAIRRAAAFSYASSIT